MKSIETLLATVAGGLLIAGIVSALTGQYGIGVSVALLLSGVIPLAVGAVLSYWSAKRRNRANRALLSQVQSTIKIAHDEARIFHRKGMYRESLASIDRVLSRAQSDQEIFLLRSLRGNNLFMLESYDEAEREYNECYSVSDSIPDIRAKGICFLNLGITLTRRGLYSRALSPLEKALAVLEGHGTNFDIGKTLLNLGSWYIHTGDVVRGLRYLKKARPRVIASYSKNGIAMLLKNLGPPYREAGKPFWFMLFSQSAYHWYRMSGNKRGMADQLCNIGNAWKDLGRRDLAIEMLQECLTLSEEIDYGTGKGASCVNLASLAVESGDSNKARVLIQRAMPEFQRVGSLPGYITYIGLLGDLEKSKGNLDGAIGYHRNALSISDRISYHKGVRVAIHKLLEDFRTISQIDKFHEIVEPYLSRYPDIRREVENWIRGKSKTP